MLTDIADRHFDVVKANKGEMLIPFYEWDTKNENYINEISKQIEKLFTDFIKNSSQTPQEIANEFFQYTIDELTKNFKENEERFTWIFCFFSDFINILRNQFGNDFNEIIDSSNFVEIFSKNWESIPTQLFGNIGYLAYDRLSISENSFPRLFKQINNFIDEMYVKDVFKFYAFVEQFRTLKNIEEKYLQLLSEKEDSRKLAGLALSIQIILDKILNDEKQFLEKYFDKFITLLSTEQNIYIKIDALRAAKLIANNFKLSEEILSQNIPETQYWNPIFQLALIRFGEKKIKNVTTESFDKFLKNVSL